MSSSSPTSTPLSSTHSTTQNTQLPKTSQAVSRPLISHNPRPVALESRRNDLASKLADLKSQRAALIAEYEASIPPSPDASQSSERQRLEYAMSSANRVVRDHIKLLQHYNDIKDIGQGLMGLVAEKRGVRVATVMEEFGMDSKD